MFKKRTWKFWIGRTTLGLLIIGGLWLTNLIWFKPLILDISMTRSMYSLL